MATPETIYLHTGDDNLDEILAMDAQEPDKRGIQCRPGTSGSAPVVLILGAPGTGKRQRPSWNARFGVRGRAASTTLDSFGFKTA